MSEIRLMLWERCYRDFSHAGSRGDTAPTGNTMSNALA